MVIKRSLSLLIWIACICLLVTSARADEEDYYRLITLSASKAATDSRSKTWKPSPDGLQLEISGMAFSG